MRESKSENGDLLHIQSDPDAEQMAKAAAGDLHAFEDLVIKYQKAVLNTAYRYTGNRAIAEELAQDVFIRAFRASSNYRPEARFTTWLFTIVRNVCLNYKARKGKHDWQMDGEDQLASLIHSDKTPEAEILQREIDLRVRNAVAELPESLRLPLILSQFEQMEYEEVAAVLDITVGAVKVRVYRARQALAEKLLPATKADVTGEEERGLKS